MKRQKILLKGILIGIISIIFVLLISFRVDARKLPRRNLSVSYHDNDIEYTEINKSSGNDIDITRTYDVGEAAESGVRFIKGFTYDTADELQYQVLPDLSWDEIYNYFIYDALLEYRGTEPDLQNVSSMSLQLKYWKGGILDYTTTAFPIKYGLSGYDPATGEELYAVGLSNGDYVADFSALTTEANFESSMYTFSAVSEETVVAETMIINIQFSNATNASTENYTFEFTLNSLNFKDPNNGEFIRIMNYYEIGTEESEERGAYLSLETDYEEAFNSYRVTYQISSDGGTTFTGLSDLYDMTNEPLEENTYVAKVRITIENSIYEYLSNSVTTSPYTLAVLKDGSTFTKVEQGISNTYSVAINNETELEFEYLYARFTDDPDFDTNQEGWNLPDAYSHNNLGSATIYVTGNLQFDEYTTINFNEYPYEYEVIPHYPDPVTPTNINSVSVEQNNDVTVNKYIDSFLPLHVGVKPTLAMSNIVSNYLSPKINELGLANVGFNNYNLTIKYSVNGTTEYEETILMYKGYELVSNGETTSYQETIGVINETTGYLTPFESIMHNYSYVLDDLDQQYTVITEITLQAVFETGDAIDLEFTLPELKFVAYEQGEIIKLSGQYTIDSILNLSVTSDYFEALTDYSPTVLLSSNNEKLASFDYLFINQSFVEEAALYQVSLDFSIDDNQYEYLSNELDFEPMDVTLLVNNQELTSVSPNKEYTYSVALNGEKNLSFTTLEGLFENSNIVDLPGSYTYTDLGRDTIHIDGQLEYNDFLEVDFVDESFEIIIEFNYPDDVIVRSLSEKRIDLSSKESSEIYMSKVLLNMDPLFLAARPNFNWDLLYENYLVAVINEFGKNPDNINNYELEIAYWLNGTYSKDVYETLYYGPTINDEYTVGIKDGNYIIPLNELEDKDFFIISSIYQNNEVKTELTLTIKFTDDSAINVIFDLNILKFIPVDQGEIIRLMQYVHTGEPHQDATSSSVSLNISSDYYEQLQEYNPIYGLQVNDSAYQILSSGYDILVDESQVSNYRAKVILEGHDGFVEFTSNIVRVQPLQIQLLMNGKALSDIEVNKEYTFTLSINGKEYSEFEYSYLYLNEIDEPIELPYTKTYTETGRQNIVVGCELSVDDFTHYSIFEQHFEFNVQSVEKEAIVITHKYEITMDILNGSVMVVDGSKVRINVKYLMDGKEAIGNLTFGVNGNALAVTETGQGYFDILAVSSGEGIAYAICETLTGETIQKSVKIKVVQATNDNVELVYKDDFNKTGTTIVGTIVIDGEKDFLNFNPRFTVQRSKDDVTEDFAFSTNKNVIEIPNTLNGKYNIKAYSPSGDLLVESTKKVAAINLDLLTRQILPFVAIVLVVVLIIFIAYILRVNRRAVIEKTLEKAMSKGNALLDKDINLNQVKKYLIYLQRVLSGLSDLTNEYDNESIGQYQTLLTLINEGLRIVDNAVKKFNILDEIAARSLIKYLLDKYLQPAHDHAKTLTEDAIKFKYERAASAVVTIDDKDIPHRPEDELEKIRDYYGIPNTFMEGSTDEANVDSDSDS